MPANPKMQQYVLLPTRGLRATAATSSGSLATFFRSLPNVQAAAPVTLAVPGAPAANLRVVDSIREDGAKLVEMSPQAVLALRATQPGAQLVPLVYYFPAVAPRPGITARPRAAAAASGVKIKIRIVSQADARPVAGAFVVAFTDFDSGTGAQGTTNNKGEVSLALGAASKKLQRLYVFPEKGFWSTLRKNITVTTGTEVALLPVDLSATDCRRHLYGDAPDGTGAGVKVAVLDTGVGPHPDLIVMGGENTVIGQDPQQYEDNGAGHGTHVAGIIAARGRPPEGLRGLAPAAELYSYRVFGSPTSGASNYAIAKAIDRAVAQGCDLLNLSLGGGDSDPATQAAIADARAQGSVVIAAAGNDGRAPVSYPGAEPLALAVSAMGRKKTFPKGSAEEGDIASPYGTDRNNFVAAFSNIGPAIDLTGPGVGIVSTVPGGYAAMSGTSMACPAVCGIAARLLAARQDLVTMSRDQGRSDAIVQVLLQAARSLGFGPVYEGQGLPQ